MQLSSVQRRPVGTVGPADNLLCDLRWGHGHPYEDLHQRGDRRAGLRFIRGRHRAAGVQRSGVREVVRVDGFWSVRCHLRTEHESE